MLTYKTTGRHLYAEAGTQTSVFDKLNKELPGQMALLSEGERKAYDPWQGELFSPSPKLIRQVLESIPLHVTVSKKCPTDWRALRKNSFGSTGSAVHRHTVNRKSHLSWAEKKSVDFFWRDQISLNTHKKIATLITLVSCCMIKYININSNICNVHVRVWSW